MERKVCKSNSSISDQLINMKKVLVTGATGFIGGYVIRELLQQGYEVITTSRPGEKAKSQDWFSQTLYIPFDLKTLPYPGDLFKFFHEPQLLIHLAWEGLPNYKSAFHVEENLPAHYLFLKNMISNRLNDITVTGTCFEYGMQEGCLFEELQPQPSNYYAKAKNELRILLNQIKEQYTFHFKWVRLFYMYGIGQNPNSLLSQLQTALDRGDKIFNMSPGDQLRDYLEVEKVAKYIVAIATQNKETGIINCCSGIPVPVKELVEGFLKSQNADIKLNLGFYPYSDVEPLNFWGDNNKLKTILTNG